MSNIKLMTFCLLFLFFSATGDPDTPTSEVEDDLGNTQGGNGWHVFYSLF